MKVAKKTGSNAIVHCWPPKEEGKKEEERMEEGLCVG